jgi:microcystin-dependent protein
MSQPFVAEIRMFGFNFAPRGWALCNGQILPISQNTALFSLLGTMYGGDGRSNFGLPDMQGSFPVSQGQSSFGTQYFPGQTNGEPNHTLISTEIPAHGHTLQAPANITPAQSASNNFLGASPAKPFDTGTPNVVLAPDATSVAGSSFPHENMPPYLALNFCIALQGIFPARN